MKNFAWRKIGAVISIGLFIFQNAGAQTPVPAASGVHSALQVLSAEGLNACRWALAPLDQMIPPDIRLNVAMLKEDVADEARARPVGTVAAYQAAYRLCTELIAVLDERDLAQVRAGFRTAQINNVPMVTSQALEARRSASMSWPQYARSLDQRSAIERQAANNGNVAKEGPKVPWAEHAALLRRNIDTMDGQFRDACGPRPRCCSRMTPPANVVSTFSVSRMPQTSLPQTSLPQTSAPFGTAPRPSTAPVGMTPPPPNIPGTAIPSQVIAPPAIISPEVPTELTERSPTRAIAGQRNTVFGGPDPTAFTPDEMAIVQGMRFEEVGLPRDKSLSYFHLDTFINNESSRGALEKEFSVEVRVLCVDADNKVNVTKYSRSFDIVSKGWQHVALGGGRGPGENQGPE